MATACSGWTWEMHAWSQRHPERAAYHGARDYLADTGRFGSVRLDESNRITGFQEKKGGERSRVYQWRRLYYEQEISSCREFPAKFSIEKDCFEKYYRQVPILSGFRSGVIFWISASPRIMKKRRMSLRNLKIDKTGPCSSTATGSSTAGSWTVMSHTGMSSNSFRGFDALKILSRFRQDHRGQQPAGCGQRD